MLRLSSENFAEFEKIGTILLSEKVFVADLCRNTTEKYTKTLENIKPGRYNVFIYEINDAPYGDRVMAQLLIHEKSQFTENFELVSTMIDVDSGVCGISDYDFFVSTIENNSDIVYEKLSSRVKNPDYMTDLAYLRKIGNPNDSEEIIDGHMIDYWNNILLSNPLIQKYERAAISEQSVFTFSGYGDGTYDVGITKNDNQIDSILLNFGLDDEMLINDDSNECQIIF